MGMGITPIHASSARGGLLRPLAETSGTGIGEAWCSTYATPPGVPSPMPLSWAPAAFPTETAPLVAAGDVLMLIRHAEKPIGETGALGVTETGIASAGSLTVGGWTRAGALVALFAPSHGEPPPGLFRPTAIWAASPRGDLGQRPEQTVVPLAARLGLSVNTRFGKGQEIDLAAALMSGHGAALVAWQHEEIPTIIAHLGSITPLPPPQWSADRFDVVWVFARTSVGWTFSQVPQLLLAGDRADVML